MAVKQTRIEWDQQYFMKHVLLLTLALIVSGCSSWVYKYDINQGNFLNQDDVDKLRIDMTKEQVEYVLGSPVVSSPFGSDTWHYVYTIRSGKTDKTSRRELVVKFVDGKLAEVTGDYQPPKDFDTPLEQ